MDKNTIGYISVIVLLSITSVFSLNLFFRQRTDHDSFDVTTFPYKINDWNGKDLEITEREYKVLETRNLISREYIDDEQKKIYLFIIYSETNRLVFHPPEVCLVGSGITISNKTNERINIGKKEFFSNKLYLEKNNNKEISFYCYKIGNFYTDSYYLQQAYFALNQLLGKHRGGATIRVSISLGEDEEAVLATLKNFMRDVINILENLS